MSEVIASDEGKLISVGVTHSGRKRPKRRLGRSMYANFRSAITSVLVYRLHSALTIAGMIVGTLAATVAVIVMQAVRTLHGGSLIIGSAFVLCAVAGLASMNSMLASVAERKREVRVRMSVGARRRDIRDQILLETLLLSSIGTLVGILLGLLVGFLFIVLLQLRFSIDPILLLVVGSMSIVCGVVSGVYPAVRATRLDVGEAVCGGE